MPETILALALIALTGQAEIRNDRGILWDTDDPTEGVKVLPVSESTWRSGAMQTTRFNINELKWTAPDTFLLEYGVPCDFSDSNLLKKIDGSVDAPYRITNGRLEFQTGTKGASLIIGARPQRESIPPMRIGAFYGKNILEHLFMEITADNGSLEETEWQLSFFNMRRFSYDVRNPFKIKGKGIQKYTLDLGYLRNLIAQVNKGGIRLTCLTKNITAKLHSLKIAPKSEDIAWRYEFNLPFMPEKGQLTLMNLSNAFELYINGKKIAEGNRISKNIHRTFNLMPYLKKGKNVIALQYRFAVLWSIGTDPVVLYAEGAAVAPDGTVQHILSSPEWRYTFQVPATGWLNADFNTAGWQIPKTGKASAVGVFTTRHGKQTGFNGRNPAHMGILMDLAPQGRKYPVYDKGEKAVYALNLPSAIKNVNGSLRIVNAETDRTVAEQTFTEKQKTLALNVEAPGAYRLFWTIRQNGKTVDSRKMELIIAGPIEQKQIPYKDFEKELRKKLKLVETVDFTKKNPSPLEFIDFRRIPLKNGESSIVTRNGLTYRETGSSQQDSYSFRLHQLELGVPYLIEVTVPDDRDRYIYCRIIESYLAPFENNSSNGAAGMPAASGTSATGGDFPLTGKTKTIRFLHVPGSTRATVTIMNGAFTEYKSAAAAIKAEIYRFSDGIPSLKRPESGRIYGQHTERPLHAFWTAAHNVAEANISCNFNGHVDAWINNYRSLKTYIQLMRFKGENAVMQGTYMYRFGIPIDKYCEKSGNDEFDLHLLFAKMYKQNGIHHFMSIEYLHPQHLYTDGTVQEVSDRQIWNKKARGIYSVDKNGNQVGPCGGGEGLNPFSKQFQNGFKNMMRDLYQRYDGLGIDGLYVIAGNWWSPAISAGLMKHISTKDISFDDDTIEQFEHDTGIHLNANAPGKERFMKRYQLLTGKYNAQWYEWRVRKMRTFLEEIRKIVTSGKDKWRMMIMLSANSVGEASPFEVITAGSAERNQYFARKMEESGYRHSLYKDKGITLLPNLDSQVYGTFSDLPKFRGKNTNTGTLAIVKEQNGVVYTASLNELGSCRYGKQPWWWESNTFTGSVKRPAGEFAFAKEITTTRKFLPQFMVDNWMDNQLCLSHDDQYRRFLQAYFATPLKNFLPAQKIRGTDAMIADNYLRLVNATTHEIRGRLEFPGTFRELVMERDYNKSAEITLRPMDQLVFRSSGSAADFKGSFHFTPEVENELLQTASDLLKEESIRQRVAPEAWDALKTEFAEKDPYKLWHRLKDYEIASQATAFYETKHFMENQRKLLAQLEKNGIARINAAGKELTDRKGNLWLADQKYTGFGAFGNEFAQTGHRDPSKPVKNADYPEVFFTEAFGTSVFYTIPLPTGKYTVELLAAETYPPNAAKGRIFHAAVNGSWKVFDLYKLSPGFLHEAKQSWNITVKSGTPVSIELKGEVGLNGIIIRKQK